MTDNVSSLAHLATDPLRNFKFWCRSVTPQSVRGDDGLMSVSGLNITTEVIPYREGGMNTTSRRRCLVSPIARSRLVKGLIGEAAHDELDEGGCSGHPGKPEPVAGADFRVERWTRSRPTRITKGTVPNSVFLRVQRGPTSIASDLADAGANAIIITQDDAGARGLRVPAGKVSGPRAFLPGRNIAPTEPYNRSKLPEPSDHI